MPFFVNNVRKYHLRATSLALQNKTFHNVFYSFRGYQMQRTYKKALFIFRRDLRLNDNTGLLNALQEADLVIPCFIFDPKQLEHNDYRSDNALQFMLESLDDLDQQLQEHNGKLYRFNDKPEDVIEKLIQDEKIDAVYVNHDYTPFSKKRDLALEKVCSKNNIPFIASHDALLNPPESITKSDGTPYTVFTPFFKFSSTFPVALPRHASKYNFYNQNIAHSITTTPKNLSWHVSEQYFLTGGRTEGLSLMHKLKNHLFYEKKRDFPSGNNTNLSPHLKFGTVSVREIHKALINNFGKTHPLIRQLYWRDFYTMIAWWFPHVFGKSFKTEYDKIQWSDDKKNFKRWCEGSTGFPIVDAGMRELNQTGFMHNRVRMIVGSFLVKDLGIDWRMGEQYFASKLVDYDPAVNNGNWQWVASTGCDAQPYFRIFNPWLQQEKFDADTIYIKRWIPELNKYTAKDIHEHWKKPVIGYPAPMLNHQEASSIVKSWFKN